MSAGNCPADRHRISVRDLIFNIEANIGESVEVEIDELLVCFDSFLIGRLHIMMDVVDSDQLINFLNSFLVPDFFEYTAKIFPGYRLP